MNYVTKSFTSIRSDDPIFDAIHDTLQENFKTLYDMNAKENPLCLTLVDPKFNEVSFGDKRPEVRGIGYSKVYGICCPRTLYPTEKFMLLHTEYLGIKSIPNRDIYDSNIQHIQSNHIGTIYDVFYSDPEYAEYFYPAVINSLDFQSKLKNPVAVVSVDPLLRDYLEDTGEFGTVINRDNQYYLLINNILAKECKHTNLKRRFFKQKIKHHHYYDDGR